MHNYTRESERRQREFIAAAHDRHTESKIETLEHRVRQLEAILDRAGLIDQPTTSLEKSRSRRDWEYELRSN